MYKFPLGAVLNHRKFVEESLQKELGELKKLLAEEKRKLGDYRKAKDEFSKELQKKQQESDITVSETLLYVSFIKLLSRRLEKQKERALRVEKDLEQKREDVIEAMKNRKTLDKLKKKGWESYRQKLMKNEQNFLNEMAAVRFKREM